MSATIAIIKKELRHYFYSPIAYVVMMIFLTITGYIFYAGLVNFTKELQYAKSMMQLYQNPEILERFNLNQMVSAPALFNMVFIFLFLLPMVMMRSFAEEKRQATEELLLTSPLTISQILTGKFIGSLIFVVALLLPTAVYQGMLFVYAEPELGPVLTGYLGVLLFAMSGIAIGLFASSLTENQIIAAFVTFLALLFMFIIGFLASHEGSILSGIAEFFSIQMRMRNLLQGMIDTRDLVYFASWIGLFLFLTKRSLESSRWK